MLSAEPASQVGLNCEETTHTGQMRSHGIRLLALELERQDRAGRGKLANNRQKASTIRQTFSEDNEKQYL